MKDGGDYSTRWIEEGLMVDIARETGAALFTFERRYFGNNVVTALVPTYYILFTSSLLTRIITEMPHLMPCNS